MSTDRDTIRSLEAEVDALEARVKELERERRDGPDVERFAERFADAVLEHLDAADATADRSTASSGSTRSGRTDRSRSGRSRDSDDTGDGDDGVANGFDLLSDDSPSLGGGTDGDDADDESDSSATGTSGTRSRTASTSGPTRDGGTRDSDRHDSDRSRRSNGDESSSQSSGDDDGVGGGLAALDALETDDADRREARSTSDERRLERARQRLAREVRAMDETTRAMLDHYLENGADSPMNAHFAAGGNDERTRAYAHNRRLRTAGLIEHVGRGEYDVSLRTALSDAVEGPVDPEPLRDAVGDLESAVRTN